MNSSIKASREPVSTGTAEQQSSRTASQRSVRRAKDSFSATTTDQEDEDVIDASTPLLPREGGLPVRRSTIASVAYLLFLVVTTLGLWLLLARYFATHSSPHNDLASSVGPDALLSNGTHSFRRTVVLISLDGAKPIYLDSGLAPHLQTLGTHTGGTSRRAEYMQPIFPTLTFPNHWALLTGLHADSHGVVANDFTLGSTGDRFYYTNPAQSWNSSWWLGDPIWAVAEKAGVNAAVLMWPGPPHTSEGVQPKFFQRYESGWTLEERLSKVLEWIDVADVEQRASLVCAYVPDIDSAAHKFGPDSVQAKNAVREVDAFIGRLRQELVDKRTLGEIVDVVVVSDHGMTTTSNDKLIFLNEVLGRDLLAKVQHRDGWPLAGLRFRGGSEAEQRRSAEEAYARLKKSTGRGFDVYWRADLPARFHLASDAVEDRLAPLWMIPQLGWSITTHTEMATFTNGIYAPIGNHGYDNEEPDMHAIFVASGPSFTPSTPQKGSKGKWNMPGFPNVHVHNLVSRIIGVPESKRADTDGSWAFWDPHLRSGL